ncbi:Esterase FE4 [Papilio machaon]|uniref:Carboxylic ester hydrolase n=1 Tax=Papilio machaon TaxID=76193 RepID=A0A194QYM3_PAPMA|nr:Esterase FE4 [Papilio machaon]
MRMCKLILCSVWLWTCLALGGTARTPVLATPQGRLRGVLGPDGQRRYYGIPYATAGRFQAPREAPPWSGVLEAVDRFRSCPQMLFSAVVGSEECLVLDVHAPARVRSARGLPVMVFIHGGAYYYGTRAHYDPEYLVAKDVVVVVINYRLNVLGFLCVNGVSNLGLRDQVAALRWVRQNIAAFGGAPGDVTLCGQSAGAAAATMHLVSRASRGLFHKVIAMSGSLLAPWAFNLEPQAPALNDARKLAPADTERDIYEVFLNSPIDDLIRATADTSVDPRYFKYSPCMDSNATDPFFLGAPYDMLRKGEFTKVPMMIGHAEDEGVLFFGLREREILKKLDEEFEERLPSVFSWCPSNRRAIAGALRSHYFGAGSVSEAAGRGLVDFYSDWIVRGTHDAFLRLLASVSDEPIYNYIFSYRGSRNFATMLAKLRGGAGSGASATHSDDIFYIFKPGGLPLPVTPSDRTFIDRLTLLITNFMRFGDPTPASRSSALSFRWPRWNASVALRLSGSPQPVRSRAGTASGPFLRALCMHGQRGHVPCDSAAICATNSTFTRVNLGSAVGTP